MLYSFVEREGDQWVTVVGAADTVAEMEAFYASASEAVNQPFTQHEQPDAMTMLTNPRFVGLVKPPYVFTHASASDAKLFAEQHRLTQVPLHYLNDKHRVMVEAERGDPFYDRSTGGQTIEQLLGLDKSDPWDSRSDEQKAEDEKTRKEAEKAKKKGNLTGDSFDKDPSPEATGPKLNVRSIEVERDDKGGFQNATVLATKGAYEEDAPPDPEKAAATPVTVRFSPKGATEIGMAPYWFDLLALYGPAERFHDVGIEQPRFVADVLVRDAHKLAALLDAEKIEVDAIGLDSQGNEIGPFVYDQDLAQHVSSGRDVGVLWRTDIVGSVGLSDVLEALGDEQHGLRARGALPGMVWLVSDLNEQAEAVAKRVREHGGFSQAEIEVFAVNGTGERLVPKGFELVKRVEVEEPPRPWNGRSSELDAMTDEQRKTNAKTVKGEDLLFTGQYGGAAEGTVIYICPRSYFMRDDIDKAGPLFPHSLDIAHLLPADLREIRPGIYRTMSRDFLSVQASLLGVKMIESLALQMEINLL